MFIQGGRLMNKGLTENLFGQTGLKGEIVMKKANMKESLTVAQYEKKLWEKNGRKKLYQRRWQNYPNSVFYYDTPDIHGATDNIGIYTSESVYSLESA